MPDFESVTVLQVVINFKLPVTVTVPVKLALPLAEAQAGLGELESASHGGLTRAMIPSLSEMLRRPVFQFNIRVRLGVDSEPKSDSEPLKITNVAPAASPRPHGGTFDSELRANPVNQPDIEAGPMRRPGTAFETTGSLSLTRAQLPKSDRYHTKHDAGYSDF